MAGGIDWFRWHHGSVTDPKFQLVARKAGSSVADVVAVWATLLEAASAADDRGNPGEPDFESIDCALGVADGTAARIYGHMADRGLISEDGRIASWDKRQPKRERDGDSSAERMRALRARRGDVTPCDATQEHVTPCDATLRQKKPRGEESREERESTRASPRGSRLPHDELPKDWRTFCQSERPDLDPDSVFARFADYWRGQPGAKGRKSDWLATWRNWVRDERTRPRAVAGSDVSSPFVGAK